MSLEPCLQSACRISPHNRYNGCMKPIIFLSVLTLTVVAIGGGFILTLLNELPPMTQYGVWPYWMLGAAIVIVILLAILFFGLMFYSARHHDHKVFKPEDFDHWDD